MIGTISPSPTWTTSPTSTLGQLHDRVVLPDAVGLRAIAQGQGHRAQQEVGQARPHAAALFDGFEILLAEVARAKSRRLRCGDRNAGRWRSFRPLSPPRRGASTRSSAATAALAGSERSRPGRRRLGARRPRHAPFGPVPVTAAASMPRCCMLRRRTGRYAECREVCFHGSDGSQLLTERDHGAGVGQDFARTRRRPAIRPASPPCRFRFPTAARPCEPFRPPS